ncbi:hypothetical protein PORCAN_1211 [Porphyromonas crevioricanis JCM 13913]|nr:hypothetical protein PORCAN_1211 [Porphyromonas crevioricanis JCM 13913]
MELKHATINEKPILHKSLNRTILELKRMAVRLIVLPEGLSIAPYWN